jgi:hypothetical protein
MGGLLRPLSCQRRRVPSPHVSVPLVQDLASPCCDPAHTACPSRRWTGSASRARRLNHPAINRRPPWPRPFSRQASSLSEGWGEWRSRCRRAPARRRATPRAADIGLKVALWSRRLSTGENIRCLSGRGAAGALGCQRALCQGQGFRTEARNRPIAAVQIPADGRPQCARSGCSLRAWRTHHIRPFAAFPVGSCTAGGRQCTKSLRSSPLRGVVSRGPVADGEKSDSGVATINSRIVGVRARSRTAGSSAASSLSHGEPHRPGLQRNDKNRLDQSRKTNCLNVPSVFLLTRN